MSASNDDLLRQQRSPKVTDFLSREEIRALTRRSDWRGGWAIASTWLIIAASFALAGWALQQPWYLLLPGVLLALMILGGRQLALAILAHEASHNTLFNSRFGNNQLSDWLCARPISLDLYRYRSHHMRHHSFTGRDGDPDLSLVRGLPTSKVSMLRKFARDLSGLTGLKYLAGVALMNAGLLKWTVANDAQWLPREGRSLFSYMAEFMRNSTPSLLVNALLFLLLWGAGWPQLYLLWVLAWLIPYPLFIRIRAMAEHAMTEGSDNPLRNTRTTRAGWLARSFVAPVRVNFHIEHHLMASVPYYHLPQLHRLLRQRGLIQMPPGYADVIRLVSSAG